MSRTDKDMPYWVQAEWFKPEHYFRCVNAPGRYFTRSHTCDLPPAPVRSQLGRPWRAKHCHWVEVYTMPYHFYSGEPRKWERQSLHRRTRARVKLQVEECIREFNTDGEVDTIPITTRIPEWFWWW
jgi:hypothetical protein